ncbi:EAL domain-containing protein [Leucothrix arctica]|uniref:Diguanylate phosphodiesterase n=1 Tax=Leucothrix arctica TaxID=1481894 RepID=A0A317CHF9_9GAMM|nr:EAL domain-containing protein [Leucothrix arctica]PWQ95682.1 diguanylate phosphodiesterase [Leucothrix arctica]
MFKGIDFSHAFQPIIDINKGDIVSYEVLLRGKSHEAPWVVFNKVEKQDLPLFDQYNREKAIALASRLGLDRSINLNFLPRDILADEGSCLIKTIEACRRHGFNSKQLTIEITESEFVENYDALSNILNNVRRENIVIAIDDFGAGYAGLNLLASIQPDLIKVDMSLLRHINENGPRQAIVRAMSRVCLDLGIDVLAEGVETEEEFDWLRSIDISLYQGFLFAKPVFESLPTVDDLKFKIPTNSFTSVCCYGT